MTRLFRETPTFRRIRRRVAEELAFRPGCDPGGVVSYAYAREIANQFCLGDGAALAGPVARGEQGQVWRLTTTSGVWAVKEIFEQPSEDELQEAGTFQEVAYAAGIPAPPVVRTSDGALAAKVGGAFVRLYGWVEVRELDRDLDPELVGRLLAAMHRIVLPPSLPVDPWYTEPVGAARWDQLVRACWAESAPFAPQLAALHDELVALETLLAWPEDAQVCHRDLWAENIRSTPAGGLCVFDWENSGAANPGQELAGVLFEFAHLRPGRGRELYEAYVEAGGPGRVRCAADFSMLIAQLGHIGERACRLWLTGVERERIFGTVEEFVADPLTRDVIDRILDEITT
jgi:aminoglycoside phosphotransferase (APT) family kinase protein